jgi:hypothetical protein
MTFREWFNKAEPFFMWNIIARGGQVRGFQWWKK